MSLLKLSNIDIFNGDLVIIMRGGEPWFKADSVAKILEHSNINKMLSDSDLDESWIWRATHKELVAVTKGYSKIRWSSQGANFINEMGLYKLIFRSRMPKANEFTNWAMGELVKIRKGDYVAKPKYSESVIERAKVRAKGVATRRKDTDMIKSRIEDADWRDYAACTNNTYRGFYGKDANGLRCDLGLRKGCNLRERLSNEDIGWVEVCEKITEMVCVSRDLRGRSVIRDSHYYGALEGKDIYVRALGEFPSARLLEDDRVRIGGEVLRKEFGDDLLLGG